MEARNYLDIYERGLKLEKKQESIFIRGKQDIKKKRLKVLEKVNVKH